MIPLFSQPRFIAMGYDSRSMTLAITFSNNKRTYHYLKVSSETYLELTEAPDMNSYFEAVIKPNHKAEKQP